MKNIVQLGSVCKVITGSTPKSTNPKYWNGNIKWLTPAELSDDSYIVDDTERHVTVEAIKDTGLRSFPKGTVILSSRAPIGKVAVAGCEMYCNQGFKNLICESKIYNIYLYWFLKSKNQYLNSLGRGATFKEISKSIVENIEIPLPSIYEQIKIAEQFNEIQHLIKLHKEQYASFDLLVKSQFIEMFGDPVQNPLGWGTKPLLEMGYCKNGMNFHTGDSGIEMHCLGVGDFKDYSVIDGTDYLPSISLNEAPPEESMLRDGDIVFVRSNGNKALVGRCLVVYPRNTPTTYSGFCIRYRLMCGDVNTVYLLRVLKTDSMRKKMLGRGANIQNLNQQILSALDIPTPPMELQNQFADFVTQVDKSKLAVQQSLNELETLKKSLMQEYFG